MLIPGETLGEKYKNFNKLSIQKHHQKIKNIDYREPDVENLLKIDIACRNRNVDFILNVFKCEDMLYVSRAIKQSVWLVQDQTYAQIINPQYLHSEVLPYMLSEAGNKLLLHIRLHLKDPIRNEKFFTHLVDIDLIAAMKWLPNCSVAFIKERLEQDIYRIPEKIFLRLLLVTMDPLRIYVKSFYWKKPMLKKAMFTLSTHGEDYFSILDSVETDQLPDFNAKYTKLVMIKCPQCLLNNFDRYCDFIDVKTFAKYIKKEALQSLLLKYPENKKIKLLFLQKDVSILEVNRQYDLLTQLLESDPNDEQQAKILLEEFHDIHLLKANKKYVLQFIHRVIKKFKTFTFTEETWTCLNNIFIKIGVYNENKKHFEAYKRSIIIYHVLNAKEVPENVLSQFSILDTYKSEQSKLNSLEKKTLFMFLYNKAEKHLEVCKEEEISMYLESVLLLLLDWGENWQNYPTIVSKIEDFVKSIKATSNKEALRALYCRHRIWRRILFNELFIVNCDESACINALKHNPKLLDLNKEAVFALFFKDNPMKRLCTKLRMFWFESIGQDYKRELMKNLHIEPVKGIFTLLPREQIMECIVSSMFKDGQDIQLNNTKITTLPQFLSQNMYRARPKPSMELVLSYGKGMYLQHSIASIKSVLASMPAIQTMECIKSQEWPEFVQKICVLQAFIKFDRIDRKELISSIWRSTKYSSVRADIFKRSYNSLKRFNKNDMNRNESYNSCIEEEWRYLKGLIESLTNKESVIVYNLLSKIDKVPLFVRTEYCITSYKLLKQLPLRCNCQRFMNNIVSKINYCKVLPNLELDFVAEMVQDTIISRLWCEKLDWKFMDMVFVCVFTNNTIEAFKKILLPILDNAFRIWNISTQGLLMVRYNMNSFFSHVVNSYKDMLQSNNPLLLNLILDHLQNNLPINENYVIITNLSLAVEYLQVLSKWENCSPNNIYEKTTKDLSRICIAKLCEHVKTHSVNIWRLFFEAWQMMLNGFGIKTKIQYKVNNIILDSCKDLSPDIDILLHIFVLEHIYYTNYGDEDRLGRKALRARIAAHPSREVKSQCSKLILTDRCSIPHRGYFYVMH